MTSPLPPATMITPSTEILVSVIIPFFNKKPKLLGEMADSRTRGRITQDDSRAYYNDEK